MIALRARGLTQKFILSLLLGLVVVLALALYGNGPALWTDLRRFTWAYVPLILGLTLLNYGLRFVKWHYYLSRIQVHPSLLDSLAIFVSGLSMAMTPGKVGEILKPVLLKLRTDVPVSRVLPVVMAERLTDGVAMVVLATAGLVLFPRAWQVLAASCFLALFLVLILGTARGHKLVQLLGVRAPFVKSRLAHLDAFLHSSRALFRPTTLAVAIGIGVISWAGEALAFYLVMLGLGLHGSLALLVQCTFILATSTLVGSLTLLPGGLGAVDASVAGLLILLAHVGRTKAAAATLMIRFCTLWFGVALGLAALFVFRARFSSRDDATATHPLGVA